MCAYYSVLLCVACKGIKYTETEENSNALHELWWREQERNTGDERGRGEKQYGNVYYKDDVMLDVK